MDLKIKISVVCAVLCFVTRCHGVNVPIKNVVTDADKSRFLEVLEQAFKTDAAGIHYAIHGYKALKTKFPLSDQEICDKLEKLDASTPENNFYISSIWRAACSNKKKPISNTKLKELEKSIKEDLSLENLYYTTYALSNYGIDVKPLIKPTWLLSLKTNDNILSYAYAILIGSKMDPKGETSRLLFSKIPNVVALADEIDGVYAQFEAGLGVTSLTIEAIYSLCENIGQPPPVKYDRLTKFANYFLSRTIVTKPKGIYFLLSILDRLVNNKFHTYVSIGPAGKVIDKQSQLHVRVSDIFGLPLPDAIEVIAISGKELPISPLSMKEQKLRATNDKCIFILNAEGVDPGSYALTLNVVLKVEFKGKALVNPKSTLFFNVIISKVHVEGFQIGISESDQATAAKFKTLAFRSKLPYLLRLDAQQRLSLKFSVKNPLTGKSLRLQQVFVRLVPSKTSLPEEGEDTKDALVICQPDSNDNYRLALDLASVGNALAHKMDEYEIFLILGDPFMSNGVEWNVGRIRLEFKEDGGDDSDKEEEYFYKPKPEIKHIFREAERRPPAVVSNFFTGFALTPLTILCILWFKLGVNVKKFPFTLSAFMFHLGLLAIFALFGLFWLQLNMFQTVKYLLGLGLVTFLSGHRLLAHIADKRQVDMCAMSK